MHNYPHLFQPLKVNGLTLKNRLLSAPTSISGFDPDSHYTESIIDYYRLKAAGGAALVTVGEVMVDLETGKSHTQQVGINDPAAIPGLVKLANAIHSGGAAASVELDHGGALSAPKFLGGKNAIGPSGYVDEWGDTVEEMTEEQIYQIADAYGSAASNAKLCGFDMVMLHAGHGWLIHQFISPLTNRRTDKWGGSVENRLRFLLLVVDKIRAAVGRGFPIDVRMSGSERTEGGYGIETGIEIAKALDGKADLLHVSAGTQQDEYSAVLMHPGIFQKPGENSNLAAEIKKHIKTPVVTVGAFSDPDLMESFLAEGHADAIAMGRALIADPFLPKKLLRGKREDITPCLRCTECLSSLIAREVISCSVNPIIGRESEYFHPRPADIPHRNVLIAGGGPGGMQAALTAAKLGHTVTLCEAGARLGGTLKFADAGGFKSNMREYRDSQIAKLERGGVALRLNTPVDKAVVDELRPDVLIAAVGADPFRLPVPGADGDNVVMGADLLGNEKPGKKVVVIGGGLVGCEEALQLAGQGYEVAVLEMQEELAPDCGKMHRINLLRQLEVQENLAAYTGMRCTGITSGCVTAADNDGKEISIPADWVVMAAGMRARSEAVERLRPLVKELYVIGDCKSAGTVMSAVRDGYNAALDLGRGE